MIPKQLERHGDYSSNEKIYGEKKVKYRSIHDPLCWTEAQIVTEFYFTETDGRGGTIKH
jgi:hypothetical protein